MANKKGKPQIRSPVEREVYDYMLNLAFESVVDGELQVDILIDTAMKYFVDDRVYKREIYRRIAFQVAVEFDKQYPRFLIRRDANAKHDAILRYIVGRKKMRVLVAANYTRYKRIHRFLWWYIVEIRE